MQAEDIQVEQWPIVLYVHTGTDSTSRLIMSQDMGVTGLPLSPYSSDVQITVGHGWLVRSLTAHRPNEFNDCAPSSASVPTRNQK